MFIIPIVGAGSTRGPVVLIIILEKENLDRMKEGDPVDFHGRTVTVAGHDVASRPIRDLDVVIAYEDEVEMEKIKAMANSGDLPAVIQHIERGRKLLPEDGMLPRVLALMDL